MSRDKTYSIRIRDPIHGSLTLSRDEIALVDHPAYQRLRTIKQLGLADLAFPGATHTRYAHGLGTMHVASRIFGLLCQEYGLAGAEQRRLLQTVRLAALFHDVGHAPLSHTTEAFMPRVAALELGGWQSGHGDRLASHEDYTLKIITGSSLTALLEQRFAGAGVTPEDVASLIAGRAPSAEHRRRFQVEGVDWMPLLRQCVSSELDADRMDYLLRDSYFAGVPYGRYDHEWLMENLRPVERDGAVYVGLDARASFAFEDYLLSRYHMFMSVYFHHIPISYEAMLAKLEEDDPGALRVPADVEQYLEFDDVTLLSMLRRSKSGWARRIVERRAYRMLTELKELSAPSGRGAAEEIAQLHSALSEAGIDAIAHTVKGQLSKYFSASGSSPPAEAPPPVYVLEEGESIPIDEYSPLYRRYAGAIHIRRLYVEPGQLERARRITAEHRRSLRGPSSA